jgi:hypothetical protein
MLEEVGRENKDNKEPCGLLPISAISSAQVGAQHLMDPIFALTPAQSKISSN